MFPKIFEFKFTIPTTSRQITLDIYSYGLMLVLGFIAGELLLKRELRRTQLDENLAINIILAAILCGLIGAKAYSIIENWRGFLENPFSSSFSGRGLAWYGGFFCGALGVLYVIKKSSAPMLATIDLIAPLLALGYAFGRMGCLLSGDGDYGPPSDLPWAIAFPNGTMSPTQYGFDRYQKLHPTPIYEIIMSLIIFSILWSIRKRECKPGSLFALYMILSGVERFIAEFWRLTGVVALGLTMAQLISITMIASGGYMLLRVRSIEHKPAGQKLQTPHTQWKREEKKKAKSRRG